MAPAARRHFDSPSPGWAGNVYKIALDLKIVMLGWTH
jgi:hypothetical protein